MISCIIRSNSSRILRILRIRDELESCTKPVRTLSRRFKTQPSLHRYFDQSSPPPWPSIPCVPSTTAKAKFMCGGRRELQELTQARRNRPRQGYAVRPRFFCQSSPASLAPSGNRFSASLHGGKNCHGSSGCHEHCPMDVPDY
ncbi:hypothetical protein E2C01_017977 [Portunus trituberculatus]|uniref:Uncharacterized protein n=1 Tax=Portunus trituberculatus TaxID=210409 RepID=A0A5B7DV96_PORTR|nr:hypothetical protein [Portunus trituberculatus]